MSLFGTDGVRGIAGQGALAPAALSRLAKAAAYLLKTQESIFRDDRALRGMPVRPQEAKPDNILGRNRILIGRDTRLSGPEIEEVLASEFLAQGVGVLTTGIIPTPAAALLTRQWGVMVGVMISASHNPPEDNGVKFISPHGLKIPTQAEKAIEKLVLDKKHFDPRIRYAVPPGTATRKICETRAVEEYTDFVAGLYDGPDAIRRMRIVVDLAYGAATATAPLVFKKLKVRPIFLHAEPDGARINVGCGATHLEPLCKAVLEHRADLGIAFDGDQDRVMFVDERGRIVDGDQVLAIAGQWLRKQGRLLNDRIVGTQMSNWGLEKFCRVNGIRFTRARVGDRYVTASMIEEGAVLGGEPSGHIIFFEHLPTGDGMITALKLIRILAEEGKRLSEAAAVLERVPQALISVPVRQKPDLSEIDPVKNAIDWARKQLKGEGRILVRYSGTQDLCRVMVEGPNRPQIERIARHVADAVRSEIGMGSG